jgi:hypothetical protein
VLNHFSLAAQSIIVTISVFLTTHTMYASETYENTDIALCVATDPAVDLPVSYAVAWDNTTGAYYVTYDFHLNIDCTVGASSDCRLCLKTAIFILIGDVWTFGIDSTAVSETFDCDTNFNVEIIHGETRGLDFGTSYKIVFYVANPPPGGDCPKSSDDVWGVGWNLFFDTPVAPPCGGS